MELNTLLNLISGVGFPMAISIYMIYNKQKSEDKTNEILKEFALNLQENTILLKQLSDMIKDMKEGK